MKNVTYLLLFAFPFLLSTPPMTAQVYDLPQYRARWERRPAMSILPDLAYFGTHSNLFASSQNFRFGTFIEGSFDQNSINVFPLFIQFSSQFIF